MVDTKVKTLLTLTKTGSYTKAAQELHLTQPAVSNHIRLLEKEFDIKIFKPDKKELTPTPEGSVLIKYARRLTAVYNTARQAVEDIQRQVTRLSIGITQTAGENMMPRVIALYCNEHPSIHIKVHTDTIKKLYNRLGLYEMDIAVVEGVLPNRNFPSVLLDTDYLCLVVSPKHPFATRQSVTLPELKNEKLILRPSGAGTRMLFDTCLQNNMETIKNFNVIMELDNINMLKDLVSLNMGVSIIARSACRQEVKKGDLVIIPIENVTMVREIHMVYSPDFTHMEVLEDFKRIYNELY